MAKGMDNRNRADKKKKKPKKQPGAIPEAPLSFRAHTTPPSPPPASQRPPD